MVMTPTEHVDQLSASEAGYQARDDKDWAFHFADDALIRYLRDRRLNTAMNMLGRLGRLDPDRQSVLVVCGGVGGEGRLERSGSPCETPSTTSSDGIGPSFSSVH